MTNEATETAETTQSAVDSMPLLYVGVKLPEWANDKQIEGMKEIIGIAKEYGDFGISFKQNDYGDEDDSIFIMCLDWGNYNTKGNRHHEMRIGFDYEQTWDCYGELVHDWQFIFAGGDATRELTTEVFFLDLFFYLDGKLNLDV
jgi:hypothetical protein